jgi:hypothetical protein
MSPARPPIHGAKGPEFSHPDRLAPRELARNELEDGIDHLVAAGARDIGEFLAYVFSDVASRD